MIPDSGTLTSLMQTMNGFTHSGLGALLPTAIRLLSILIVIELVWFGLKWALVGGAASEKAFEGFLKVLTLGVFVWFVTQFDWLVQTVIRGFLWIGATAAGADANAPALNDPSSIVDAGFIATQPILDHLKTYGTFGMMANLPDMAVSGGCALLILLAFGILAIQVFVTYIEFGIVTTLGFALIPFGVNSKLSFLAEKVFGAIIAFGIKLMVLAFVISITFPLLAAYQLPADATWQQMINMAVTVLAVLVLSWHAPSVAAGMLAGGPSLTATTAIGTGVAAAAGLGLLGVAGSAAGRQLGQATLAAARGAGAVNAGYRLGGVPGAVTAAAQTAAPNAANVGAAFRLAYAGGAGQSASPAQTAAPPARKMLTQYRNIHRAVPKESQPSSSGEGPKVSN